MAQISVEEIARALGHGVEKKNSADSWNTVCPCHNDSGPSLSVSKGNSGKILVHCHAGCSSDAVIGVLKDMGLWFTPSTWTAMPFGPKNAAPPSRDLRHPTLGTASSRWCYINEKDQVCGYVYRYEDGKGKTLLPVNWCRNQHGDEKWWFKGFPEPRPLYNANRLKSETAKTVLVVEGEKTADAAQALFPDYLVVTWQGGSKAVRKTNWTLLQGRNVIIWRDADEPGIKAQIEIGEILIALGVKSVRAVDIPEDFPKGWDLADEVPAGFNTTDMLNGAQHFAPSGDLVVDKFNRDFALVMLGGQATVLKETQGDAGRIDVEYISLAGFKEYYGNVNVLSGKQQIPEGQYWLKHEKRRSYESVIFKPNFEVPRSYNLWRGFSVDPDPSGSWGYMRKHIFENLARGDEYLAKWITAWFAQIVQHPETKTGTSLCIRGKMGTGKTIIGKAMGELYKSHYVLVDKGHLLTGNFNGHMASCLLLHADEAFWAGDPRHVGQLRSLVTSDTLRIEQKGKDSFELDNYVRLLVTSNNDWVAPVGFEERRFATIDAGEGRMQDKAFFQEMWRELKDGGLAAMLYDLQHFDLNSVDIGKIPSTAALQEQKVLSMDSVSKFWLEKLNNGEILTGKAEWPEFVIIEDLYQQYVDLCTRWGEHRKLDAGNFGKKLKKLFPEDVKQKRYQAARDGGANRRAWGWSLKSLQEHRDIFCNVLGESFEWQKEEF